MHSAAEIAARLDVWAPRNAVPSDAAVYAAASVELDGVTWNVRVGSFAVEGDSA